MVEPATNNRAIPINDNGANRDLARCKRSLCLHEGFCHKVFVHCRMLNYPAMKSLQRLVFLLLLMSPLTAFAQGVRMSADFLPLDVGKRWTYEVTSDTGQKVGEIAFAVEEYTIVSGVSFYVLSEFPFSPESGEPIRFVRYDKNERSFIRRLRNDEGPLFLEDGSTTEVIESDSSGNPQKFVLRRDKLALTFQRGVGIIEARMEQSGRPVIAKLAAAAPKTATPVRAPSAPVAIPPVTKAPVVLDPPLEPPRREPPVATVNSDNPKIDVTVNPTSSGFQIGIVATNVSDKILPFRFSSGQTYDVMIADASGKEIWRWSHGNFFTQVLRTDSIRAGGKWQFEVSWDGKDNDGNPVPAGQYRVTAVITSNPRVQFSGVSLTVK